MKQLDSEAFGIVFKANVISIIIKNTEFTTVAVKTVNINIDFHSTEMNFF